MNKDEIRELFQDQLSELDEFENDIKKIRRLINLLIENFDLLKDDITEEQIGEVSSDINIKLSKIIAFIKDILSDSKKLESFVHEVKLLKRKREEKLRKNKEKKESEDLNQTESLKRLVEELQRQQQQQQKIQTFPQTPLKNPKNPYTSPPNKWDIQMNINKKSFHK